MYRNITFISMPPCHDKCKYVNGNVIRVPYQLYASVELKLTLKFRIYFRYDYNLLFFRKTVTNFS